MGALLLPRDRGGAGPGPSSLPRPPAAVYVTSPDYLGLMQPIEELAQVCHRHGTLLLVDNAHGAYLHFLPKPCHPMDLGGGSLL